MKKILATLLILTLTLLSFVACSDNDEPDNTTIRVGYMAGPTGMGMAKLMHDNAESEKYTFTSYQNTKLATADLLAGNVDVICLPTDEAANYYNTTDSNSTVLAINTLNTLFLVTDENTTINSFADLEGKTIYTCSNGTPADVLGFLLSEAGINATIATSVGETNIVTPKDLGTQIVAGSVSIALAPEPIVTSSMLQRKQQSKPEYSIDLNMNDVWNEECDTELTMGCIVANKKFTTDHKELINEFLSEYEASIEFISNPENLDTAANYVVESEILGAIPAAKSALQNLGSAISYIDGEQMQSALENFYRVIGISLPKDAFYYEK